MNEKNIIREAMKVRGYTFFKFLTAMGFDVVIKDRNKDNKGNSWVLTEARETEKDE